MESNTPLSEKQKTVLALALFGLRQSIGDTEEIKQDVQDVAQKLGILPELERVAKQWEEYPFEQDDF